MMEKPTSEDVLGDAPRAANIFTWRQREAKHEHYYCRPYSGDKMEARPNAAYRENGDEKPWAFQVWIARKHIARGTADSLDIAKQACEGVYVTWTRRLLALLMARVQNPIQVATMGDLEKVQRRM